MGLSRNIIIRECSSVITDHVPPMAQQTQHKKIFVREKERDVC